MEPKVLHTRQDLGQILHHLHNLHQVLTGSLYMVYRFHLTILIQILKNLRYPPSTTAQLPVDKLTTGYVPTYVPAEVRVNCMQAHALFIWDIYDFSDYNSNQILPIMYNHTCFVLKIYTPDLHLTSYVHTVYHCNVRYMARCFHGAGMHV